MLKKINCLIPEKKTTFDVISSNVLPPTGNTFYKHYYKLLYSRRMKSI